MIYCRECNKIYLHYTVFEETKGLLESEVWCEKGIVHDDKNDCYLDVRKRKIIQFESDYTENTEYECIVSDTHTIKKIETDLFRREEDIDYVLSLVHDYEIDLSKLSVEDAFKLKQLLFPEEE